MGIEPYHLIVAVWYKLASEHPDIIDTGKGTLSEVHITQRVFDKAFGRAADEFPGVFGNFARQQDGGCPLVGDWFAHLVLAGAISSWGHQPHYFPKSILANEWGKKYYTTLLPETIESIDQVAEQIWQDSQPTAVGASKEP